MDYALIAKACLDAYDQQTYRGDGYDAEVLIQEIDGAQVVAFRGTEASKAFSKGGWIDILTDLRAAPWYSRDLSAWVHAGFWKSTRSIAADIEHDLDPRAPLYITGHSLGGAMACVFAAMCVIKYRILVNGLVTFGAPRVGGEVFCGLIQDVPGRRFVRDGDKITCVPPWFVHDRPAHVLKSPGLIDHPMEGYLEAVRYLGNI